jgi:hypothetical protein
LADSPILLSQATGNRKGIIYFIGWNTIVIIVIIEWFWLYFVNTFNWLNSTHMHKQRLILAGLAIIGMVSTFLPWFDIPFEGEVDGSNHDGWYACAAFAIILILTLVGDRDKTLDTPMLYAVILAGAVAAGIAAWQLIGYYLEGDHTAIEEIKHDIVKSVVDIKYGVYLSIVFGIACSIAALVLSRQIRK